jgi:gluconolactonase
MIEVLDVRWALVAEGAPAPERLCTGAAWSEGPVWMREDDALLWSDIPNNRILRWHARDGMSVWRDHVEFTNGHVREADGSLLHCSHGRRAIMRTRFGPALSDPTDSMVVGHYQGRRLNSPNDIVVKSDGTIWFTDPPYGILSDREGHKAPSEIGRCCVYRFDPETGSLRQVSDWLVHPNGLAFSPDESVLYVTDTSAAVIAGGMHHIVAFDVIHGQELERPRVFAVIEPGVPDGLRVDAHGHLYVSSGDSVQVYHSDGTRVGRIPVPETVGNLVFGGRDGNELYICASRSLYRTVLNTRGATA